MSKSKCTRCVGFEVLTAVIEEGSIFYDVAPCSPVEICRRFG
jgi:hypothetical protein